MENLEENRVLENRPLFLIISARGYLRERGHLEPSPPTETFLTAASLNSQIPNFDPEQSFPS